MRYSHLHLCISSETKPRRPFTEISKPNNLPDADQILLSKLPSLPLSSLFSYFFYFYSSALKHTHNRLLPRSASMFFSTAGLELDTHFRVLDKKENPNQRSLSAEPPLFFNTYMVDFRNYSVDTLHIYIHPQFIYSSINLLFLFLLIFWVLLVLEDGLGGWPIFVAS